MANTTPIDEPLSRTHEESSEPQADGHGGAPVVFISYAHESPTNKAWVASLATDLVRKGVDVILDQWETTLGSDLTLFMEQSVRSATRVLMICTPTYCRKANEGEGGVGWERLIVTGEMAKHISTTKFICVLKEGDQEQSIPSFAQTRLYIDFSDEDTYEENFDKLLRDIHEAPALVKPELGQNPFQDESQASELNTPFANRSTSLPNIAVTSETELREIAKTAEDILRRADLLGWRKLVRRLKRQFGPALLEWRQASPSIYQDLESWTPVLDKAVLAAAPLMVLALTAVESGIPEINEQSGLLDDLIAPTGWENSGASHVVETPSMLGMVYHYVLGAFLVSEKRHDQALDLLQMPIVRSYDDRSGQPLWKQRDLTGWPDALGSHCVRSWEFICTVMERHEWISEFFVSEEDFLHNLQAYQCLASIIELGDFVATGQNRESLKSNQLRLDVPPMFMQVTGGSDALAQVIHRAIPRVDMIDDIADRLKISPQAMLSLWPEWFGQLIIWNRSLSMPWFGMHLFTAPSLYPGGPDTPIKDG